MDNYDYNFNKLPPNMKLRLENAEIIFPQYFTTLCKTVLAIQLDLEAEYNGESIYRAPYKYTIPVKKNKPIPWKNFMLVSRTNFAHQSSAKPKAAGKIKSKPT